jgi:hypothetical protein
MNRVYIKTIKTWNYENLPEELKEKVLEKYWDINVDYEWYDYIYEDAKNIGLKITSFDLYKGYCKINWVNSAYEVANKILKEHGEQCETYKDAKQFIQDWNQLVEKYSDGININQVSEDNEYEFDKEADELEEEFLKTLQEDYRIILQNDYDYLTSREAIEKTLISNEYEFTEAGSIY